MNKKSLKGKLMNIMNKNIVLCEKEFHPAYFTESIPVIKKTNADKFKSLDKRNKPNIYTNKTVHIDTKPIVNNRYFDYVTSPDELVLRSFTCDEIATIKSDPVYFNLKDKKFRNVEFFKSKNLLEVLNEEEKEDYKIILKKNLAKSVKQSKKKINNYLNDYHSTFKIK